MSSFYRGLRRTNRVYNAPSGFIADHTQLIKNNIPSGFNFLDNPTTISGPNNTHIPGYGTNNTNFTSNSTVNRVMRNNDVTGMQQLFPSATPGQINSLGNLRQLDNIPDATINSLAVKKTSVRTNNPETATKTRNGVQGVLDKHPRLNQYLKTAGIVGISGVSIYLIVNVADMVGSIVDAMNRTGGSWWYRGNNGATSFDNIERCVLRARSCGMPFADISDHVCTDPHNPNWRDPYLTAEQLTTVCQGYSLANEETVCRASDPYADFGTAAYYDVSELGTNEIIQCVEPYDMADLIADLGLDNLLGDNGILTNSSASSQSVSDNFITILLIVGGVIVLLFVMFIVIKMLNRPKS
ncbi:occlusion-derived virus envelope protein ODV-E56 [Helicoverpa armigera granulovirus]|uniref:Occlusion-derived virus envelope protein ODV-E56 n=1 Tax=Helicoverpa armigera granulovirus TaxID=489830 RepID=A9YMK6_9BBAC|nr:occlusion-derived virus envelope protein ODV-E56 [Helicoverpa armigera granulovirus]ABY47705.1 occlusion-derived virus envelope protein ODV-E56 [Helicoverpa armigera granulovirus]